MPDHDDEDYFLPLEDQRVFGAGIRRKRVPFVRSSEHELNTTSTTTGTSRTPGQAAGPSIADRYLSIVLPSKIQSQEQRQQQQQKQEKQESSTNTEAHICEVCKLPLPSTSNPDTETETETETEPDTGTDTESKIKELQRKHAASVAHQVCLTHSHPPSHLDRTRHGLRYLSAYGWDPDSRLGLGASGREGIREPIRGRLKVDTVGLGVRDGLDEDAGSGSGVMGEKKRKERERRVRESVEGRRAKVGKQKLNAKEVRMGDVEAKRRGERLQEMFYQKEDLGRYLS